MIRDMKLTDILKELYTVSGFRMSLYDASRKQVCVYPKDLNPFCTMVQENREALVRCRTFDCEAFDKASETGEVYIYKCHCGLYEAVAPLYDFGMLSGFLMMGQVTDTVRPGRAEAVRLGAGYGGDREMLKRSAQSIPVKSEGQIRSCAAIMELCAGYLSLSNYIRTDRKNLADHVRAYLDQHLKEEITLERLCREFYCSRASMTTAFRKAWGVSIIEYLNTRRMERGMELLERTNGKVGDIALACGCPDQNYFCKRFKKYYGISPSQVRNSLPLKSMDQSGMIS